MWIRKMSAKHKIKRIWNGFLAVILLAAILWGACLYNYAHNSKSYNVVLDIQEMWGTAAGSGVIISEDGYILTAAHCLQDATYITVILPDGNRCEVSEYWIDSIHDIGIIKLDIQFDKWIELSDSELIEKNDIIYNIGNRYGIWDAAISWGLVYVTHYQRDFIDKDSDYIFARMHAVAGCSGGGVYHYKELIGILVMGAPGGNFIVPSNQCREFYEKVRGTVGNRFDSDSDG